MTVVPIRSRLGRRERDVVALAEQGGVPLSSVWVVLARKVAAALDWECGDSTPDEVAETEAVLGDLRRDIMREGSR